MAGEEYKLDEYGKRIEGYDGPYHPSAEFDPNFVFANAGDPKAQAQYQNDLVELAGGSGPTANEVNEPLGPETTAADSQEYHDAKADNYVNDSSVVLKRKPE